jgi:hypothetical protein
VVLGETAGTRILGQVREADRFRIADEGSQQTLAPVGQVADPSRGRPVDSVVHELGEAITVLVDDADGRVPGVRQVRRRLADPVQRGVQFQSAADGTHRVQQLRHPGQELGRGPLAGRRRAGRRCWGHDPSLIRAVCSGKSDFLRMS